ncbi:YdbC family protein [Paenibacillus macerans]|nr:YdbC family protein [Paenibacillus macerans]MEC0139583.1 YdbC family protein [Paenibacillus macerans]
MDLFNLRCFMLIKWVTCTVASAKKEAFSQAQSRWSLLSQVPGFIAQIGGWKRKGDVLEAHIFGFWETAELYREFMDIFHDEIFPKTGQPGTYESISVRNGEFAGNISTVDVYRLDRVVISQNAYQAYLMQMIRQGSEAAAGVFNMGGMEEPALAVELEPVSSVS